MPMNTSEWLGFTRIGFIFETFVRVVCNTWNKIIPLVNYKLSTEIESFGFILRRNSQNLKISFLDLVK